MNMNRIAFIIPYFGKFNNYFPLWLKSCATNIDVADFFVVTDILYKDKIPDNVKFIAYTWDDLVKHIQSLYNFPITIEMPYCLCDYKCAYGDIFGNIIKDYSHWAYGDNDLIWGRWSDFLPHDWHTYDKLGEFGHLTIIKNCEEMNTLYRFNDAYKIAFSDNRNLFFDEQGFNKIVELHHKKYCSFKIADCNPRIRKLSPITPLKDTRSGLFMWKEGDLFHIAMHEGKLERESVMYIHFLKRKMMVNRIGTTHNCLLIHDVNIDVCRTPSDEELARLVKMYSTDKFYWEYWRKYLTTSQLVKSIDARVHPVLDKMNEIESTIFNN